ncbi:MAG: TonB-dependent receptor, partial [Chitinophagaceae bacterium]
FSIANVLNYLPGQTILKPTVSVQGVQGINLRSATSAATLSAAGSAQASGVMDAQNLNERFGLTVMVDGVALSNNANMQGSNTSFMGMFSANNITNPDAIVPDRSQRNGTLYSNYGGDNGLLANTGIDLRTISADNVERVEVISGVASARYGDYTTGIINIDRQAGVSPLRISLQHAGGSVSSGISKGLRLGAQGGNLNLSFDYLHSNDDPRDKLKAYERIGGGLIWTWQQRKATHFKNTLSIDYRNTLDRTRLDPDEGNQRMARFSNKSFNVSNRSNWIVKKPWLYDIELRASYGVAESESYDQWFLNTSSVIKIAEATETSTYEGRYGPGYYLAFHHIKGKPVNASVRLETNSIFRLAKNNTYKLTWGIEYRYSANKGPGVLNDPEKPRFDDQGYKNDRPLSFNRLSTISNKGIYLENVFITRLFHRTFRANAGVRGDWQNGFFTAAPRLNAGWNLLKNLTFNIAYGIATKAPGLSQLYPGNVYFDIPLLELYSSTNPEHQLYLVHTEVVKQEKLSLKPYSSYTFETGFSWNGKFLKGSVFYTNRIMRNGFATNTTLVPVTVDNYAYATPVAGQPINYYKDGTQETFYLTYSGLRNGLYSRSNSWEIALRTAPIQSLRTSFDINTAVYSTYYRNKSDAPDLGSGGQVTIDYTKDAVFGIFNLQDSRSLTVKSTVFTNTHVPALRMTIGFTGEIFWVAKTTTLARSVYPHGYYTKAGQAFYLSPEQAMSPAYANLLRRPVGQNTDYRPATVYPNVHLRLAKEIGDAVRISFNAFNVFNIRPVDSEGTSSYYYNGQPSYSAAMIFSIK